ncbi:glycosyltransferase family 39 protein [Microvirga sp. STR05]|uniref:Glycosyltransferase family 39 protein n=1 Tax=Hymenobacter duratus TaxID=2771356 RepID=A0ABR8JAH1_9BACT|nr:glycosyltransferase family 39 protein [Hymenobacter duratus]MBD2713569.1 glycosyltransferase family 39 protein [Hymenobacter duratus]MBR7948471.1 glycosyltransferase family 39 protein [Microvirga sp. STR05]
MFLLLALAFFSFFFRLGSAPMQLWDESRLALNAAQMLKHQQWLITMYQDQPDLWNTKPPLMIWLQALSIQALGYTELAVRLPAALAALATTLLLFWYGQRYLRGPLLGWLAAVVLVSAPGYVGWHVARTGDYDALLVLWTTAGVLAFGRYLATESRCALWLAAAAFTLAVFTKGVAGVLGLPALVLAAAFTDHLPTLWRRRDVYLCGLIVIGIVGSYYAIREAAGPGYLAAVWANELGGRAGGSLEGHQESVGWYTSLLAEFKFSFWLAFAVVGFGLGIRHARTTSEYQLAVLCGVWVGWYLLLLSSMQTKLTWYDAPIYPALALLAALGIGALAQAVHTHFQLPVLPPVLWVLGALLLLWGPYANLMSDLTTQHRHRFVEAELQFGRHLQRQHANLPVLTAYTLLMPPSYNGSMEWYGFIAERTRQHQLTYRPANAIDQIAANETVVVCGNKQRQQLVQQHAVEVLWQQDSCATLRVIR